MAVASPFCQKAPGIGMLARMESWHLHDARPCVAGASDVVGYLPCDGPSHAGSTAMRARRLSELRLAVACFLVLRMDLLMPTTLLRPGCSAECHSPFWLGS